jgi:beta-glucanase (GH16 family)
MMRRPQILAALAAGLIFCSLPVTADAATTLTQNAFSIRAAGSTVTLTANLGARPLAKVDNAGFCVTGSARALVPFGTSAPATIPVSGLTVRVTATLEPGTYSAVPCVTQGGTVTKVGAEKSLTVAGTTPTPTPAGPEVLFSDDFTGSAGTKPDASKWGEWSYATFNGAAAYGNIMSGERSTLDGQGHLRIPATPSAGTSISTKDDFTFTYGTMTARMMVPRQAGYWPSFWSLNGPPDGSSTPLGGEVDAIEAYTQYNDGYRVGGHNYVNGRDVGPTGGAPLVGGRDIRGEWHDYGARIEPNKVTLLFDGTEVWSFDPSSAGVAGQPWAFGSDAHNWMLLTLAVGSGGQAAPTQDATLLVDRVEVRSL